MRCLLLSLLTFCLLSTTGPVAAFDYVPGATPRDTVSYSVTTGSTGLSDPIVNRFTKVTSIDMTVVSVIGQDITVRQLWRFSNGTDDRQIILSGNVASGTGNYSNISYGSIRWFIAGGLKVRDLLGISSVPSANVNSTLSASYAGATRTVNTWNVTTIDPMFSERDLHFWDKNTGLLLERLYTVTYQGKSASLDVRAVQTSIPYPDFTITASQSSVNATSNMNSSSTIKLVSQHGFNSTVQLSLSTSPGLSCRVSPSSLLLSSNSTSVLTCHASSGSFTARVNATVGTLSHETQVAFRYSNQTSTPGQTARSDSLLLYALIISIAAVVGVTAFLVLRRRKTPQVRDEKVPNRPAQRPRISKPRRRR